jgi:hypothetical protein
MSCENGASARGRVNGLELSPKGKPGQVTLRFGRKVRNTPQHGPEG